MKFSLAIFFLALSFCSFASPESLLDAQARLCKMPQIQDKVQQPLLRDSCKIEVRLYRDEHDRQFPAPFVIAPISIKFAGDAGFTEVAYFIETPDGLVDLGNNFTWFLSESEMWQQLHIDGAFNHGIAGQLPLFADRVVRKIGGQYCQVLAMTPPFVGELADCGGDNTPSVIGSVGYGPGLLTQRQIAKRVCDAFAANRKERCEANFGQLWSRFERDEAGVARYQVRVRRYARISKIDQNRQNFIEERQYVATADGLTLQEVSREWTDCSAPVNGYCKKLLGPPPGED